MNKRIPQEVQKLEMLPKVEVGESVEGFDTVKKFLARFGYLGTDVRSTKILDETTSTALVRYQAMHGLPLSGVFDEATKEMMMRARCGFPDIDP